MGHFTTRSTFVFRVSLFDQFKSYLQSQALQRKARLTHARMMGMNTRDLADIGLTRDDVKYAVTRPIHQYRI